MGVTACLLALLYVEDDFSYDRAHAKRERIYRVIREDDRSTDRRFHVGTLGPLAEKLAMGFPEVEHAVRLFNKHPTVRYEKEALGHGNWLVVDQAFERVFGFSLEDGDLGEALKNPYTVVISSQVAQSYFGGRSPIGETLEVDDRYVGGTYTITGVLRPLTGNLSWPLAGLDFVSQTVTPARMMQLVWNAWTPDRSHRPVTTYLLLGEGTPAESLGAKLDDFVLRAYGEGQGKFVRYHLQPLSDVYMRSARDFGIGDTDRIAQIWMLFAVAAFTVGIACVNFANMMTSQSTLRVREIAIRQAMGATRGQQARQYLSEAVLTTAISVAFSLVLASLSLPYVNELSGKALTLDLTRGTMWIWSGCLVLIVAMVVGVFPAHYLSSLRPATALSVRGSSYSGIRPVLLVLQFAVCIVMVTMALVARSQMRFVTTKDLGVRLEGVVNVHRMFRMERRLTTRAEMVKDAFLDHPDVLGASALHMLPGEMGWGDSGWAILAKDGDPTQYPLLRLPADHDFLDLFEIPLLAGRNFQSGEIGRAGRSIMLSQKAVVLLGFGNAAEAIGQDLTWRGSGRTSTVVGVVADFHVKGLQHRVEPLFIVNTPSYWSLALRVGPHVRDSLFADLERIYKRFQPNQDFGASYAQADLGYHYGEEKAFTAMVELAAILAVVVACLGMFGLSAFVAERKARETGIRRVLGASIVNLAGRLLGELGLPVVLASVVSLPLSYKVAQSLLEPFAYRIDPGPSMYLSGCLIALLLSSTSALHWVLRVTRANPVESLRHE